MPIFGFVAFVLLLSVLLRAAYRLWRRFQPRRRRSSRREHDASRHPAAKRAAPPVQIVLPPVSSVADLPPPKWAEPKRSELHVNFVREGDPAKGDWDMTFVVMAQARLTAADRPLRLVREVILTTVGPDKIGRAVHTINAEWKQKNREDFEYSSRKLSPTALDTNAKEWLEVLRVPVNQLEFARRGQNVLRARVTWRDGETGRLILQTEAGCQIEVTDAGYLDRKEEQTQPEWPSLRVVAAVLHLGQAPAEAAVKQLEKWVDAMTAKGDRQPPMVAYRVARVRQIMQDAARRSESEREIQARDACRHLAKVMNPDGRAGALEFFFRYAAFDGKVTPKELNFAKQLTEWLEVPAQRARELRDKFLPVTMHVPDPAAAPSAGADSGAEESLLGLRPGMSPEQRRQHLNAEYRKWNARADHPDPRIREQARLMIEKIAGLRQRASENSPTAP
jgi:hypothetical protein